MAGIYISYPFCQQKCTFCNFASDVARQGSREQYHAGLLDEIRSHEWRWEPDTLYLGGGTPSLMPADDLRSLLNELPGDSLREATIECAPGTVTRESAALWRTCGLNRVSLGVQSFAPEELRLTGRRHTAQTVQEDVDTLRTAGIENINLDLIAGLPEQTRASWEISLGWIEKLAPTHVSVYIFEVDEDSRLGQEVLLGGKRYGAARLPSEEATAEFYELAVERLAAQGLARYEISNFALPGCESRHNLKYWQLDPYVGFGLDAHSYDGERRWSNPDTLDEYLQRVPAVRETTDTDRGEEHFFVGLRLMKGIEPTPTEWARFAGPIERWTSVGMLEREGRRLRLSPAGVLVSNEIFAEFVP